MGIKRCQNKCIFCFIDQLPEGLRKTLYLKDDDYLESFKYGNFITLTNLTDNDLKKIIKYRLSPLYVSFHSADSDIRNYIFNTQNNDIAVKNLIKLDKAGIKTHIQIVICPRINDDKDLLNTLGFLNKLTNVKSIGIVPVGITRYNKNKNLDSFEKTGSNKIIELINSSKTAFSNDIYLSDEFYLLAERELPAFEDYKNFPQIENGIGLTADFFNDFNKFLDNYRIASEYSNQVNLMQKNINTLILTSEYFFYHMHKLIYIFKRKINSLNINLNFKLNIEAVKNHFFGGNVKVMGLLSYDDIYRHLLNKKDGLNYDKILISDIIFNNDKKTLDDKDINDFKKISKKIVFVNNNGKSLAKELLKNERRL